LAAVDVDVDVDVAGLHGLKVCMMKFLVKHQPLKTNG
jgi:hypothetical protein